MKHKKFLAMLMALAMMFSLCVGAFADDPAPAPAADPNAFQGTATVQIPTIAVSVTNTATLFINPMGFKVKLADGSAAAVTDEEETTTTSKIVSPVNPIVNNSPMQLSVGVIGSITPKETNVALALSPTPIAADDTKNSVFIYANFGVPTYTAADDTATPPVTEKYVLAAADYSADTATTLALTNKAPTTPVVVGNIAAATVSGTGDSAVTTPGRYAFQFLGECNPNAKNAWNSGDQLTVNLAFTFKPVEAAAAPAAGG